METTKIGKLNWLIVNLNLDTFLNGDKIKKVDSDEEWEELSNQGVPLIRSSLGDGEFSLLYNQYVLTDPRGFIPEGWRIPTDLDWKDLVLSYEWGFWEDIAPYLRDINDWGADEEVEEIDGVVPNESGFTSLPAGRVESSGEICEDVASYWTLENGKFIGYEMDIEEVDLAKNEFIEPNQGLSIRLVKTN
jgi:uncharacterized protein (TIGR02145 family)